MRDKVLKYFENESCPKEKLLKIWELLYKGWEEIPDSKEEAYGFILDEISNCNIVKIKKIYKILFNEEDDEL
jgi:hypothetical protein